jgi:hypothetical protein
MTPTLPTREEIATWMRQDVRFRDAVHDPHTTGHCMCFAPVDYDRLADALLARLRPAWQALQQEVADLLYDRSCELHPECKTVWCVTCIEEDRSADRETIAALTEQANHYSERVGKLNVQVEDLRADLRACAEALRKCPGIGAMIFLDEATARLFDEWRRECADPALARSGIKAVT